MKMQESPWGEIEKYWPAYAENRRCAFETIKQKTQLFLSALEIQTYLFSHYGLVVHDINQALETLNKFFPVKKEDVIKSRVAIYKVHVARCMVAGKELEFVAPSGPSFFNDFLNTSGEGLHHLSFYTPDMRASFAKLREHEAILLDTEPRQGSHGTILFFKPGRSASILIELCQKN